MNAITDRLDHIEGMLRQTNHSVSSNKAQSRSWKDGSMRWNGRRGRAPVVGTAPAARRAPAFTTDAAADPRRPEDIARIIMATPPPTTAEVPEEDDDIKDGGSMAR